jgi:uncharacterized protein YecE (DUF72 family)
MPDDLRSIRIGTCGWSYKDWVGQFYPKGLAPADYLPYYAEHFSIVEVDSTFYRSPSKSMVQGWRDKTPGRLQLQPQGAADHHARKSAGRLCQ